MSRPRTPKTIAGATALLERFAAIGAEVELIEGARNDAIARANAAADVALEPLLGEQSAIAAALEPWWAGARDDLTGGKRKSVELGGCLVGSKRERFTLGFANGGEDEALQALLGQRWAKPYVHVRYSVHRVVTLAGLDGRHGEQLKALGFEKQGGADAFFVRRAEQGGTLAP